MIENQETVLNFDLAALLKILLKHWLILFGGTTLITIIGLVYAFTVKEEFISEGKILPEVQSKSASIGQFAGLAALAGVDLAGATGVVDAIRPDLYPDVLKSTPFFLMLINNKMNDKNGKLKSFHSFYIKEVLDGKVKKEEEKLKYSLNENYTVINLQTEKIIKDLRERIVCIYEKKTGIITIMVKLPDPVMAANVAHFSMNYLTTYIIDYRIEKQKRDLDFLERKLYSAKGKYFLNQNKRAIYSDEMPLKSLRLQSADLQRERIESEYKISSSFYNSLLQKYEEAKFKIQQETPIIKILEPPTVPNLKSEPKKSIILMVSFFLGVLVSFTFILFYKKNYKKLIIS